MSAVDTLRDALFGNPPSPTMEPSREGTLAAFTELHNQAVIAMASAAAGLVTVSDTSERDAFYSDEANQGKLVYVNNNNGADDDPANGVYEYVGGEPRIATGFYQGVASVVQPLVDEAGGYKDDAEAAVAQVQPFVDQAAPIPDAEATAFAVVDEDGLPALDVDTSGNARVKGSLRVFGGIEPGDIGNDDIDFAVVDSDVPLAVVDPEGVVGAGTGSGGGGKPQAMTLSFSEPWTDPSRDLAVTWISDAADGGLLEWREEAASTWLVEPAFRSRTFPARPGLWLHTALLVGLSPNTIYEYRPARSSQSDKVKTCPDSTEVKLCMVSDFQVTDYSSTSRTGLLGAKVTPHAADLLLLNGDYVVDNGLYSDSLSELWLALLFRLTTYRTTDGAQMPWIATIGNHEGSAAPGMGVEAGALWGGNGHLAYTRDIFSCGYAPGHPQMAAPGVFWVRLGWHMGLVCLDTDHCTPLPAQFDWFERMLDRLGGVYGVRHIVPIGHAPPFSTGSEQWYTYPTQGRALRNDFWTAAQARAQVRTWLSAHTHALHVSPLLKMDYDAGLDAAINDFRFYEDSGGVRQIGCGPAAGYRATQTYFPASTIDGTSVVEAMLHYKDGAYEALGTGITDPDDALWHCWLLTYGESAISGLAVSSLAEDFYSFTDSF